MTFTPAVSIFHFFVVLLKCVGIGICIVVIISIVN
jgi:hypothetical protein